MHLLRIAGVVLITLSLLLGTGEGHHNYNQEPFEDDGVCPIINPIEISIGHTLSCALLEGSKAVCWKKGKLGHHFDLPIPTGTKNIFVSEAPPSNAHYKKCKSRTGAYICILTDVQESGQEPEGQLWCKTYKRNKLNTLWGVVFTGVDVVGVNGDGACAARNVPDVGGKKKVQSKCRAIHVNDNGGTFTTHLPYSTQPAVGYGFYRTKLNDAVVKYYSSPSSPYMCQQMWDTSIHCTFAIYWGKRNTIDFWEIFPKEFGLEQGDNRVAVGRNHVCAIDTRENSKYISCWGDAYNWHFDVEQFEIPEGWNPVEMIAGNGFTCAITADGNLECFGITESNIVDTPERLDVSGRVVPDAWAGSDSVCVLMGNAGAFNCFRVWDCNDAIVFEPGSEAILTSCGSDGIVGGTDECTAVNPVDLSLGTDASCGLLPPGGEAMCWDSGYHTTARILGDFPEGVDSNILQVAVSDNGIGESYICILLASQEVLCKMYEADGLADTDWGIVFTGADMLGVNNAGACAFRNGDVPGEMSSFCRLIGVDASGVVTPTNLEAEGINTPAIDNIYINPSSDYMCRKLTDGKLLCTTDIISGTSVEVLSNVQGPINYVAVGKNHICAIEASDKMWCWGEGYGSTPQSVQKGSNNAVLSSMVAGDGFTCYITNNQLWCFGVTSAGTPVGPERIRVGGETPSDPNAPPVFTVWATTEGVCAQVNDGNNYPTPGSTVCYTVWSSTTGIDFRPDLDSKYSKLTIDCAPSENCVVTPLLDDEMNHSVRLNKIPIDMGSHVTVEGADDDSYFGLPYSFHPEQFTPPGMSTAMFAYFVPLHLFEEPTGDPDRIAEMDRIVKQYECIITYSSTPLSTRVNKKCFQQTTGDDGRKIYVAKVVLRTCILKGCNRYPDAESIFAELEKDATDIFTSVAALDKSTLCPYYSKLDFTVRVPLGNLVETTQDIELKWARDDVSMADPDSSVVGTPVNDDLSANVHWAVCDRSVDITEYDAGFDYDKCFDNVEEFGNMRVIQLSQVDTGTPDENGRLVPYNQLSMALRLASDDRRLVSAGYLTLVPEKCTVNLFHVAYPKDTPKTAANCILKGDTLCTQTAFDPNDDYIVYHDDTNRKPDTYSRIRNYEVGFRGNMPIFNPATMGCGKDGFFCTIVVELTFVMGGNSDTTTSRRLHHRRVQVPMRLLQDDTGLDYEVALATASENDFTTSDVELGTVGAGFGGLLLVAVGAAFFVHRRKGTNEEPPGLEKSYDVEAACNKASDLALS